MSPRLLAGLALPLLLAACASAEAPAIRATPLSQTARLDWRAANPHGADGVTAFRAASADEAAGKVLEAYQTARTDYPSVGGDILRGVPRTPLTDLQPVGPAAPGSERLREPAPRSGR